MLNTNLCFINGVLSDVIEDFDFSIFRKTLDVNKPEHENMYWYHKDHLGSSTQISDRDANIIHHVEYMPSGEQFSEQRDSWATPYKFNSKELDAETGLYYYGARYYTPEIGIWLSVDPLSDKYPSLSPFAYCANNPVMLVDPDGREIKPTNFGDNEVASYYSSFVGGSNRKAERVFAIKPNRDKGTYSTDYSFKNIQDFKKNADKAGVKLKGENLSQAYNAYQALRDNNVVEIQGVVASNQENPEVGNPGQFSSGTILGDQKLRTRNDNIKDFSLNTNSSNEIEDSFNNSNADVKGSGFIYFKDKTPQNAVKEAKGVLYINAGNSNHQENLNNGLNNAFEQIYGN